MAAITFKKQIRLLPLAVALLCSAQLLAYQSRQARIPLPAKSRYTPVQQLNRDGVQALKKHNVDRAKRLFYKAYLIDPDDPFTLNNLGYVAELEGDIERAQRYYEQAQANASEAVVDKSTEAAIVGKSMTSTSARNAEGPMKVNEMNTEALRLLKLDRAPEADLLLQKALKLDAKNPFTLNNMGYAKEKEGELEDAVKFYDQAGQTGSRELVVVTINKDWRGKPISEIAARNSEKTRQELERSEETEAKVKRLNLRGVSAINRNERAAARSYFEQAYKLDAENAFALNNMGYLAELEGDKETAQAYYDEARVAERADKKVEVSTRPEAEGRPLEQVAKQSTSEVEERMQADAENRKRTGGPPALRTRDNRIIIDKVAPKKQEPKPPAQNQASPEENQKDQEKEPEKGNEENKQPDPTNQPDREKPPKL